ncbi:MAG: CusA/CzcA family heavy metal efflux RND transporter [Rickettsiales bacterium]|nr:CusA/CzcA family heavy metal efflux RND transporter [Rickettsiales bacterium]
MTKERKFFKKLIELRSFVLIGFGLIAIFGFYSLQHVKIDAIPDITNKQVIINSKTFGMDPTLVEKSVTYPIESELYGIPDLAEMRSLSKFGLSQITLIFKDQVDINLARNQVMQRLSAVGDQIPPNIRPTIAPLTTGIGEIIIYRLFNPKGSDNLMELRTIQEFEIARELKKVSGVAEVDTIGGFERQIHLNIDPRKITDFGMTEQKLINQIQTIGENFGGGYIEKDDKQKIVRTYSNIKSFDDVMNVPIKIDYKGNILPLRKVVEIRQEESQRLGAATYKGQETVIGTIMLQSGENSQEVLNKVKKAISKINESRSDVEIEILYDRQFLINSTIKTVIRNLCEGILLVVGVLCLVLGNISAGLVVSSSLIFCIFILGCCMKFFEISANLMSLGAIDFGILVDSSVVIVEYLISQMHKIKSREEKIEMIAKLTAQVAKPTFIGIAIITLVYIPILMFTGVEGKTFQPMAINVIIAMCASLITAFFLMPVLAFLFIKDVNHKNSKAFEYLLKFYEKILDIVLRNQNKTIIVCLVFFIFSMALTFFMPSDFLPNLNEGDLVFTITKAEGSSLSKTIEVAKKFEENLKNDQEIDKVFSRIGTGKSGLDPASQNICDLFVILKPQYKIAATKLSNKILQKLKNIECDNCNIVATKPIEMRFNEMLEGSRADLSLRIFGDDLQKLIEINQKIHDLLKDQPQIKEIEEDMINSIHKGYFVDVIPDYEKIVKHQITLANVNNDLSSAMAGFEVGKFYATEFPISIILHLDEKNRSLHSIENIPVNLSQGGSFPLSDVVTVKESVNVSSIPRLFGQRYAALSIYLKNTEYEKFIAEAESKIKDNNILPPNYKIEWKGRFKNFNNAKQKIFTLVPLIILAIFFILKKMFGSYKKVLVVLSSIPFALSGAVILLFICHIAITVSVYVGFIALIGISLLNSIILINSMDKNVDLRSACLSRFRAILMTAIVASLGFLPMSFGHGIGAEVQQPIAITVIGGIISSTATTLLLIPALVKKFLTLSNQFN